MSHKIALLSHQSYWWPDAPRDLLLYSSPRELCNKFLKRNQIRILYQLSSKTNSFSWDTWARRRWTSIRCKLADRPPTALRVPHCPPRCALSSVPSQAQPHPPGMSLSVHVTVSLWQPSQLNTGTRSAFRSSLPHFSPCRQHNLQKELYVITVSGLSPFFSLNSNPVLVALLLSRSQWHLHY